jgi:hypothetical protein
MAALNYLLPHRLITRGLQQQNTTQAVGEAIIARRKQSDRREGAVWGRAISEQAQPVNLSHRTTCRSASRVTAIVQQAHFMMELGTAKQPCHDQ